MSTRMNTMSVYRRRSSAFVGSSFQFQNRRASDIVISKGLSSYQCDFGDIDEENAQAPSDKKRDWNKLFITFVLCYGNFCVGSAYSVLGPLFPSEGKLKMISETWIGLIMSQYEVAIFLGSLIFGKLIPYINAKHGLIFGLMIAGMSSIGFGFLHWCPFGTLFIVLSMLIRTSEGLGAALFFITGWTIVGLKYPQSLPRIFALTEMFYAIGMIFGPGIGGILEELGRYMNIRFTIPFEILGLLMLLGTLFSYLLIKVDAKQDDNCEKISILTIVKNFSFSINLLITINGCILIGFNDATLSLHLKDIQTLSPSIEGSIFVVQGAVYAMFNPMWGYLVDKVPDPHQLCLVGCFFCMVNYIISGPIPYIPVEPNLYMVIIGQAFLGFAMGGLTVGSFTHGFQEVLNSGFQENVSTYAVVSASFSSAFALGSAIGPAIGGFLIGKLGYRWATLPMVGLEILFMSGIIGFSLWRNYSKYIENKIKKNDIKNNTTNGKIDVYV